MNLDLIHDVTLDLVFDFIIYLIIDAILNNILDVILDFLNVGFNVILNCVLDVSLVLNVILYIILVYVLASGMQNKSLTTRVNAIAHFSKAIIWTFFVMGTNNSMVQGVLRVLCLGYNRPRLANL